MRILITNDDGISAPGLKAMEEIAHSLSDDVWVVAPSHERSGVSRAISMHDPLRMEELSPKKFHVSGTPADCVIMTCRIIMPDHYPDVVLSGVNRGANMADDCLYSGTIGAAMEGSQFGIRSFALSQTFNYQMGTDVRWDCATGHAPALVEKLMKSPSETSVVYNINFPNCAPNEVTGNAITKIGGYTEGEFGMDRRVDNRGIPYYWLGFRQRVAVENEKSDLYAIRQNKVSITPIHRDLTVDSEMIRTGDLIA